MSISFTLPLLLGLIPIGIAALFFAYRKGGRADPRVVGSVFLLRKLASEAPAPRKIVPPLRILLEILLLMLLVGAAAQPYLLDEGRLVRILVDNSYSTQAAVAGDRSIEGAQSVWDEIRSRAEQRIAQLPFAAQVSLWRTSPQLEELTNGFATPSEAVSALRRVSPVYGRDDIMAALRVLRTQGASSQIVVVSDRAVQLAPPSNVAAAEGASRDTVSEGRIESIVVAPRTRQNLALVDARQVLGTSGQLPELELSLEWYGVEANAPLPQLEVEVSGFLSDSGTLVESSERHRISPEHGKRIGVPVIQGAQAYRLALRVIPGQSVGFIDSLQQDNEYYLVPSNAQGASLVVVSDLSANELGLTRMRGVRASRVSIEEYTERGLPDTTSAVLFHRFVPELLPNGLALGFVMPPPGNTLVSVAEHATPAQVSAWRSDHPLTRYVRFAGLTLPRSLVIQLPGWGTEIFRTVAGVTMVAGELQGRRIVVMGVEPFPFEGARSPLMSVLLLNVLSWIGESGVGGGAKEMSGSAALPQSPHMPLVLPTDSVSGGMLVTTSVRGEPLTVSTERGITSVLPLRTGIVYLPRAEESERFYPINFVDASESDLGVRPSVLAPSALVSEEVVRQGLPLERWLIFFALAVLLADWLYRVLRLSIRTRQTVVQVTHVY